jgi:hypothetical protein
VDHGTRLLAGGLFAVVIRILLINFYLWCTSMTQSRNLLGLLLASMQSIGLWWLIWMLLVWRIRMQSAFCRAILVFLAIWNLLASIPESFHITAEFQNRLPVFAAYYAVSYIMIEILYIMAFFHLYQADASAWFRLRMRGGLPKPKATAGPPPRAQSK